MDREINFLENNRNRVKKKRLREIEKKVEWTSPEKLKSRREEKVSGGLFGGWKEVLTGLLKKDAQKANNNQPAITPAPDLLAGEKNYPWKGRSEARKINKFNEMEERMLKRKKENIAAREKFYDKEKAKRQKEVNYLNGIGKVKKKEAGFLSGFMKKITSAIGSFHFLKTGEQRYEINSPKITVKPDSEVLKKNDQPLLEKENSKKLLAASAGIDFPKEEKIKNSKIENISESGGWEGESFRGTNLIKERISMAEIRKRTFITVGLVFLSILAVGAGYYSLGFWKKSKAGEKNILVEEAESLNKEKKAREADLSEAFAFEQKLKYAKLLLDRHVYFTNLFVFLEKNTLENVYYSNFTGDNGGVYELNATAKDFKNIARQIESLKANPLVKEAATTGGDYAEGEKKGGSDSGNSSAAGINFILKVVLDKSIFFISPE
jgi:hypothetical protein